MEYIGCWRVHTIGWQSSAKIVVGLPITRWPDYDCPLRLFTCLKGRMTRVTDSTDQSTTTMGWRFQINTILSIDMVCDTYLSQTHPKTRLWSDLYLDMARALIDGYVCSHRFGDVLGQRVVRHRYHHRFRRPLDSTHSSAVFPLLSDYLIGVNSCFYSATDSSSLNYRLVTTYRT